MKSKKSNSVDQEDKKHLYVFIGLIISLTFALSILEWTNFRKNDITIESSFVPKIIEEPILELKPIIPIPVNKTVSNDKPSEVKIVEKLPVKNTIKVKAKVDPINVDSLMAIDQFETDSLIIENIALDFASEMPKFPGGNNSLFKYLSENIIYPEISLNNNSQGKVLIEFIVEKNGSISNIKILKGVDPFIDAESIRVVSLMPKWIPGKQMNNKVRVRQRLPIKYKLQN